QGRQVQTVGWFVQNQKIPAPLQNASQQQSAALAATQIFHLSGQSIIRKQKPLQIRPQGKLPVSEYDKLASIRDLLQHRLFLVEEQSGLIDIIELSQGAGFHRAVSRAKLAQDEFEQR